MSLVTRERAALLIACGLAWAAGSLCAATPGAATPSVATPRNATSGADALAPRAQQLLRDANAYWSQRFAALGGSYLPARLTLFDAKISGVCESSEPLTGAFYCPGNQQIYLDEAFQQRLQARTAGDDDAALAYVIGHEIAHHVQSLVGTTALVAQARANSTLAVSTRTWTSEELQSDCYAGLWLGDESKRGTLKLGADVGALLAAIAAVSQDQQAHLAKGVAMPDPILTYGTAAQRLTWFQRGLRGMGLPDCDTFKAEAAGKL